jgi:hypothetical protein
MRARNEHKTRDFQTQRKIIRLTVYEVVDETFQDLFHTIAGLPDEHRTDFATHLLSNIFSGFDAKSPQFKARLTALGVKNFFGVVGLSFITFSLNNAYTRAQKIAQNRHDRTFMAEQMPPYNNPDFVMEHSYFLNFLRDQFSNPQHLEFILTEIEKRA